jgi:DNA repair exonuclease SbcCD ATPase subunit
MRIIFIKLINFIGVNAAMGLKEVEFSFDKIDKPIIQIYGKNRCGKTVLIQQLHPFSSINLNGDERSDLPLIIPKETGIKNIVYEVNGDVYNITHTYTPTKTGHSISSSLKKNGEELNPSGGVTVFNSLIEKILGINKYVFQFILNGTQLTSFGNMTTVQRKNLLNKALGIDIYDKIHKLATDDYRYTNKLIVSLNNTKEYILSQYGSYENLCVQLNQKQTQQSLLSNEILKTKENMDTLKGVISSINSQNPSQELMSVNNQIMAYNNVVSELGSYDPNLYDNLVNEQMELNALLNSLKSERTIIKKDIDVLYEKRNDINNTMLASKRASEDYNNMINMKNSLAEKINNINIELITQGSSSYYKSMIQLAQAINDTCTEIASCLNEHHMKMFVDMITNGVDISAFLIQEGSVLMDSEKEMSVVSRIKSMVETIDGEWVESKCPYQDCIHLKTHRMLQTYFKSYQSTTESQFTQYDLEQIDHAYKNVQTIRRLLNTDVPGELIDHFKLTNILANVECKRVGIDVSYITYLMEEAAKNELRNQYVSQLTDIEASIERMKAVIIPTDNMDEAINEINNKIDGLIKQDTELGEKINTLTNQIDDNDRRRLMLSQIKHINITDVTRRKQQLDELINKLDSAQSEYSRLSYEYNEQCNQLNILNGELKMLTDAHTQYTNTMKEIDKHDSMNGRYKVIAEATSSTKGKPVIAIRDTVNNALSLTNRLLDIMYDGEIELLEPTIDETSFTLPFRCGSHTSSDIRYGSQSESTLLSLALELSLVSSLTPHVYALVDEIDAYLDAAMHGSFLMMLQEMMATLKMEQMFLISHNVQPGQYDHIVHTIDLSR